MTDMDGNANLDANQGEQKPHSDGSADADVLKTLQAINSRLTNLEGQQRALQSGKDRGIAGLQDEVHKMKTDFGEILEYGAKYTDPAEAERAYQIDKFLQTANQQTAGAQGDQFNAGLADQQANTATVDPKVLDEYGIDPQSPEYLAHVKDGKSSFEATLAMVAGKQAGVKPEGEASGASGGAGPASPASGNERQQTALKAEYDQAVNKQATDQGGYLSPRQLYFIQQEFVEKGMDREALGW